MTVGALPRGGCRRHGACQPASDSECTPRLRLALSLRLAVTRIQKFRCSGSGCQAFRLSSLPAPLSAGVINSCAAVLPTLKLAAASGRDAVPRWLHAAGCHCDWQEPEPCNYRGSDISDQHEHEVIGTKSEHANVSMARTPVLSCSAQRASDSALEQAV